jgi:hypothetical protein
MTRRHYQSKVARTILGILCVFAITSVTFVSIINSSIVVNLNSDADVIDFVIEDIDNEGDADAGKRQFEKIDPVVDQVEEKEEDLGKEKEEDLGKEKEEVLVKEKEGDLVKEKDEEQVTPSIAIDSSISPGDQTASKPDATNPFDFFSFNNDQNTIEVGETNKTGEDTKTVDLTKHEEYQYPSDPTREDDKDCPFLDSSLYRSVYVYPTWMNETDGWHGPILSTSNTNVTEWPWLDIDRRGKEGKWGHYGGANNQMGQYTLELIVRELMTHPDSCLRTMDPMKASLFYVPYLPSTEFHNGKTYAQDYSTSPYGAAVEAAIEGDFSKWEEMFGLTSDFWKRKNGADHILVFSEPLHGLSHPRSKRGSYHFINTQKMLTPPIIVSIEVSTTFVEMYPKCSAKNIVVPYPNPDGNWFNGNFNKQAFESWKEHLKHDGYLQAENSTLSISSLAESNKEIDIFQPRPMAQFYSAGGHGECAALRKHLKNDYQCTPSSKGFGGKFPYHIGMRSATFCPCPGGDSPSAKRMFDAVNAGCIPIILSHDYVWPFTKEADPSIPVDPSLFGYRWNATNFMDDKHGNNCELKENVKPTLQAEIEKISGEEIATLRHGLKEASYLYSYWSTKDYSGSDYPLRDDILPDGGASRALIKLLGRRAGGSMWGECKVELEGRDERKDARRFKC